MVKINGEEVKIRDEWTSYGLEAIALKTCEDIEEIEDMLVDDSFGMIVEATRPSDNEIDIRDYRSQFKATEVSPELIEKCVNKGYIEIS